MKKLALTLAALLASSTAFAQTPSHATYIGKIKNLYLHERSADPYFGIELEGQMDINPCGGGSLNHFVKKPEEISATMMSMLLAAHMAGKQVKITSETAEGTSESMCHNGVYPKFVMFTVL